MYQSPKSELARAEANARRNAEADKYWAERRAATDAANLCPYTVGKRACVSGAKGHAGPHNWPKVAR